MKLNEVVCFHCFRMEPVKRAANFTNADRQLIVELVAKYSAVVENKKTDHVTNVEKEAAWRQVGDEFIAINSIKRDVKQLKQVNDLCTLHTTFVTRSSDLYGES